MKVRFTTLDIMASLAELKNRIIGARIINIYDVNTKTYLLKLVNQGQPLVLLIESGIRIHSTDSVWPKNTMPSSFAMKLRKHLRRYQINDIFQFEIDRVVGIRIGQKENTHFLIIELFDKGNIILCDWEKKAIAILRRRRIEQGAKGGFAIGSIYSIRGQHNVQLSDESICSESLVSFCENENLKLKEFLQDYFHVGFAVIEQLLETKDQLRLDVKDIGPAGLEVILKQMIGRLHTFIEKPSSGVIKFTTVPKGNDQIKIFSDFFPNSATASQNYDDSTGFLVFDSFVQAVDVYFSQLEKQREDLEISIKEKSAFSKLHNVEKDIDKRTKDLQLKQDEYWMKASILEHEIVTVDKVLFVIRNAMENELSWDEIEAMVKESKAQNNPIAANIDSLRLMDGVVVLSFWNADQQKHIKIDVNIASSAYTNVKAYHTMRKDLADKARRTNEATEKAIKSAKKRTNKMLKQTEAIVKIEKQRRYFWFEKFRWFVSSQNYLVVAGRDQQQNAVLVRKHMSPDDIFVHSTVHGGAVIIVKNPKGGVVPLRTLTEACHMANCFSRAWDTKVVSLAYWVFANQVSRVAPSGSYVSPGSFLITGKRNFVNPENLNLGYGILFKVSDEDSKLHTNDRRFQPIKPTECIVQNQRDLEEDEDEIIRTNPVADEVFVQDTRMHVMKNIQATKAKSKKQRAPKTVESLPQCVTKGEKESDNTQKNKKRARGAKHRKHKDEYVEFQGEVHEITRRLEGYCPEVVPVKSDPPITETAIEQSTIEQEDASNLDQSSNESDTNESVSANEDFKESLEIASSEEDTDVEDKQDVEQDSEDILKDHVEMLSTLIEHPNDDDEILFCLAICAPYTTVSDYKFKTKLQPGTTKRGKETEEPTLEQFALTIVRRGTGSNMSSLDGPHK